MLRLACLALGKYRLMFGQPDLVLAELITISGNGLHGCQDCRVFRHAEITDLNRHIWAPAFSMVFDLTLFLLG